MTYAIQKVGRDNWDIRGNIKLGKVISMNENWHEINGMKFGL